MFTKHVVAQYQPQFRISYKLISIEHEFEILVPRKSDSGSANLMVSVKDVFE